MSARAEKKMRFEVPRGPSDNTDKSIVARCEQWNLEVPPGTSAKSSVPYWKKTMNPCPKALGYRAAHLGQMFNI